MEANAIDQGGMPDYMLIPFMRACGNIIPLRWLYLKTLEPIPEVVQTPIEQEENLRIYALHSAIGKLKDQLFQIDTSAQKVNDEMQEAIKKRDWGIISLNLEDRSELLNKESFAMLAGLFDHLSSEEYKKQTLEREKRKGRPETTKERDKSIVEEFRTMMANSPKGNISQSQYKSQVQQALATRHGLSKRNFDKIVERYIKKETFAEKLFRETELATAKWFMNEMVANEVDLTALIGRKDVIHSYLESVGDCPTYFDKMLDELERFKVLVEQNS